MPPPHPLPPDPNVPALNPYGSRIRFTQNLYPPPGALYMGPNDFLNVNFLSPTTSGNIVLNWTLLKYDGTVETNSLTVATVTGPIFQSFVTLPAEGFLLGYLLTCTVGARGQCYARVFLQTAQTIVTCLSQGYIAIGNRQTFPNPVYEESLSGTGWQHTIHVADVTGGTPSWTVAAGVHWKIRSVMTQFTSSAAGVARSLSITVFDGLGNEAAQLGAAGTIAPSTSQVLNWAPGLTPLNSGLFQGMGFPREMMIPPGYVVAINAVVLDVGDKFQLNNLFVEEYVGL